MMSKALDFGARKTRWRVVACAAAIVLGASGWALASASVCGHGREGVPHNGCAQPDSGPGGVGSAGSGALAHKQALSIGKRIREAFRQSAHIGFMKFLSNLGPGVEAKKAALCEIAQNPERYRYLERLGGPIGPIVLQTLRFIEQCSPPEFSLACFDSTAQLPTSPFSSSGKVFFSLHSYLAEKRRDKGLAVCKGLKLGKSLGSFSSVVEAFFRMPGVFNDILCFGGSSGIVVMKSECKKPKNLKRLERLTCMHRKRRKDFSGFFSWFEYLHCVAKSVLELQEKKGDTNVERRFMRNLETLRSLTNSISCAWVHGHCFEGADLEFITIFQGLLLMYTACSGVKEAAEIEGGPLLFPKEAHRSTFRVDQRARRMFYSGVQTEPTDRYAGFAKELIFKERDLHHVYYVDNEEQARKPVIIPQCYAEVSCAEVVKYISELYEKPQSHIHVFLMNLYTHALAYKDAESTPYFCPKEGASEVLVFYYIVESISEDTEYMLVEFRPVEEESSGPGAGVVRLPLFLNSLMINALAISNYTVRESQGGKGHSGNMKSIRKMCNAVPHVLACTKQASQEQYPLASISMGPANTLDVDMSYALSSVRFFSRPCAKGCFFVSYLTRKPEKAPYHPVFIGRNAKALLKQILCRDLADVQVELFGLEDLFWRVWKDIAGNARLDLLGRQKSCQLGLRSRILRILME
ncbi:uncharacterized protein NEMAJ01_2011 [Nematocida major]|uniref:uncharacterized protein n=1 Tax=Nematocida major TaxID=1912982 RepID=UPI002008E365|nr:uncharacterized protein NEMAJ01_2011 [Nematocida major]KAH9387115.1 hypothetical protein NEMAJ01_2011 [Nematocida major]